jgi:hypothetical protein
MVACFVPSAFAVIVEEREYHGNQVMCVHSGLVGIARSCGTDGYARVFTGIVRSAVEKRDTDKVLEIVLDEVFVDDLSDATVTTDQACLRTEIRAGDRWLFYLSRDAKSNNLILSYDSPSKPIGEAEYEISLLRNLWHLSNAGLLIGNIERLGDTEDAGAIPLANHKVIAKNVTSGARYTKYTNENGHFEFELPVGTYDVTIAPQYGLREVEDSFLSMPGTVSVEGGKCWQHDFGVKSITAIKPKTDGVISGHVGSPDGKPFTVHPWVQILSIDSEIFTSAYVDAKGYFEAKCQTGALCRGLGIRPGAGYFSDVATPVYFPGVRTKEEATVIELRPNEKRTNVDFQLPPGDILKPLGRSKPNP